MPSPDVFGMVMMLHKRACPAPGSHNDDGIKQTASLLGPGIKGKVLIDATNPLSAFPSLEVRWEGKSGGPLVRANKQHHDAALH
jgi:hypothetical protein